MSDLTSHPPSDKFVYKEVTRYAPITRQALLDETNLPESTLSDALDRLENRGYILRTRKSDDFRQVVVDTVWGEHFSINAREGVGKTHRRTLSRPG